MNTAPTATGLPLEGVRVIEFTHMVMGPTCGMILADLGAEVIKIEPPGGDKTRNLPGLGIGFFRSFNRNKKSVVLDIDTPDGHATAVELIGQCDVMLENFRPGLMTKLGLDYDTAANRISELGLTPVRAEGPVATNQEDVNTVTAVSPTGTVDLGSTVTLTVYANVETPNTPTTAPTVTVNAASTQATISWPSFQCPPGQSLSAYNVNVSGAESPGSVTGTSVNVNVEEGSTIVEASYSATCGSGNTSADSPTGSATVPQPTPSTTTPPTNDPEN